VAGSNVLHITLPISALRVCIRQPTQRHLAAQLAVQRLKSEQQSYTQTELCDRSRHAGYILSPQGHHKKTQFSNQASLGL
jgi:hypothetical protein